MATRAQITLRPELQRPARERAAQLGVSLAEYVRRLVVRDLADSDRRADSSRVFNLGNSGGSDASRDKDALIEAATVTDRRPLPRLETDPLMQMAGVDDFEPQPIDEVVYR